MEAVVDQPLGDVFHIDAGRRLEGASVDDTLVRDETVLAGVQQLVVPVLLEPLRDVVGVEDRHFGGECQAFPSHHRDVRPRDRQNRRAAPRTSGDGPRACRERHADVDHRMRRQMRGQMLGDADGSHAGSAAAVRNAERLVEIQVAHIGADVARPAQADLRVHVGAVHVDLAAMLMHDFANLLDGGLEDAVG